jgi:hypothetical protein
LVDGFADASFSCPLKPPFFYPSLPLFILFRHFKEFSFRFTAQRTLPARRNWTFAYNCYRRLVVFFPSLLVCVPLFFFLTFMHYQWTSQTDDKLIGKPFRIHNHSSPPARPFHTLFRPSACITHTHTATHLDCCLLARVSPLGARLSVCLFPVLITCCCISSEIKLFFFSYGRRLHQLFLSVPTIKGIETFRPFYWTVKIRSNHSPCQFKRNNKVKQYK